MTPALKFSFAMLHGFRCAALFDALSISHHQKCRFTTRNSRRHLDRKLFSSVNDNNESAVNTINSIDRKVRWDDRIDLQGLWSNKEKRWEVNVEWRNTSFGAGVFSLQDIKAGSRLRQGLNGINLIQFHSIDDIEHFCKQGSNDSAEYNSKLLYVKDYMWGFNPNADNHGYDILSNDNNLSAEHEAARFFGMWVPGNGLNHNSNPNTVYRPAEGGTGVGIDLVALDDINEGDELFDDYRRHGSAPSWLLEFSNKYNVSLNFAECNDFVLGEGTE